MACARKIEERLNKTEGIENASVNFITQTVKIVYDPNVISTVRPTLHKIGKNIDADFEIIDKKHI